MYRPPPSILRKSAGAFDLPSIITGVVVVGILTAGVLAAIFGVIPFAQDRGAKQDLSSIRTAEGVAKAKDNRFMDHQRLLDIGYLQLSSTEKTMVKADAKGTCYVGIAKSGTGTLFYSTDASTDPQVLGADTDTGCLSEEELAELIDEVGGIEEDTAEGAVTNLKLTAVSPLQAKATWGPVKKASGYKVEYRVGDGEWTVKHEKTTATTSTISALPEETVSVKVYALTGESVSEPSTASVRLPDSVLKNPSFEEGWKGWTTYASNVSVSSEKAHTGSTSLKAWTVLGSQTNGAIQTVTVPDSTPVLTYWSTAPAQIRVSSSVLPSVATGATEGEWVQYKSDFSDFTGRAVPLAIVNTVNNNTYMDDIAFSAALKPDSPRTVAASSRLGQATVTWSSPVFGGGTPVTGYTVTAWLNGGEKGRSNVAGNLRQATVEGLQIGNSYTFTVVATNDVGLSEPSQAYGPVEILAGRIANPSFEQDAEAWALRGSAGAANGIAHSGSMALNLPVNKSTATTASQTISVSSDQVVLTYWATSNAAKVSIGNVVQKQAHARSGESGWDKYKVDVSAFAGKTVSLAFGVNGTGYLIDDIALEPAMASDAPTNIIASSRLETATVTWNAPAFVGGTPITSYTATAWLNGDKQDSVTVDQGKRSATLSNLKAGSNYTFNVTAQNAVGESVLSPAYGPLEITTGAFANAGFEYEMAGWVSTGDAASISTVARTGQYSLQGRGTYAGLNQSVSVPPDATAMTFWAKGTPLIKRGDYTQAKLVAVAGETVDGWTKYSVSAVQFQGKTQGFWFGGGGIYDDIAIE